LIFLATLYAPAVLALLYFFEISIVAILLSVFSFLHVAVLVVKKSRKESFLLPFVVLFCSFFAFLFNNKMHLQFAPLLISLGFLALFAVYGAQKRSIPLEATIRFTKKELSESQKVFLMRSHNWWIATLLLNSALHLYVLALGDTVLWALYASVGWYILFGISLALNIIIGKVVVEKNSI